MKCSIMVAQAQNRVIGRDNKLPWYLPEDLKYFKRVTMGKPVIMGRKTFESIGKPLPGRLNIVISRNPDYQPNGCRVAATLDQALALAESQALIDGVDEAVIIGGAEIYNIALPIAERLYITQVHAEVAGDAFFPVFSVDDWHALGREDFQADGPNPYDYSFIIYERRMTS